MYIEGVFVQVWLQSNPYSDGWQKLERRMGLCMTFHSCIYSWHASMFWRKIPQEAFWRKIPEGAKVRFWSSKVFSNCVMVMGMKELHSCLQIMNYFIQIFTVVFGLDVSCILTLIFIYRMLNILLII